MNEILIDVQPVPQPKPNVLAGGDCGYCCLAGCLGVTVPEAYEITESRMVDSWQRRQSMCGWRWRFLLASFGLPPNEFRPKFKYYKTGAVPVPWNNLNWIEGVQDHLTNGRVLVSSVRFNRGPPPPPHMCGDSDHNVLITGYRERWEPVAAVPGAKRQVREVRVGCSVKGAYWMDWEELLYHHGAYPSTPFNLADMRAAHANNVRAVYKPDDEEDLG